MDIILTHSAPIIENKIFRVHRFVFKISIFAWLYTLLCSASISLCSAQSKIIYNEEKYRLEHYSDDNGLPQNSIRNIAMDNMGFVWIAAENGLVRFDGKNLDVFGKENLPVQTSDFFELGVHLDLDKPQKTVGGTLKKTAIIPSLASSIYAGSNGNTSFSIVDGTVQKNDSYFKEIRSLSLLNKKTTFIAQNTFTNGGNPSDHLVIPCAPGSFYLCTENKISFYSDKKKQSETLFTQNDITGFFTKKGKLFYAGSDGNILSIKSKSIRKRHITGDLLKNPKYDRHQKTYQIFWNITGDQVLFYLGGDLYEISENDHGELDTRLILDGFDFVANDIVSAYYDSARRRCFLGSRTKGLFVLTAKVFQIIQGPVRTGDENNFYAQTAYGFSSILTPGGSVLTKNTINGKIESRKIKLAEKTEPWKRYTLLTDKKQNVWSIAGTKIFRSNQNGEKVIHEFDLKLVVNQLFEGLDGSIYLGSQTDGLLRITSDRLAVVNPDIKDITYIAQIEKKCMWVGSGKGLYKIDLQTKSNRVIPGTEKMYVRSILLVSEKNTEVWFTTYDHGFFLYQNGKLTKFPLDSERYLSRAHCIVKDKLNFLWLPTNHGLFQMSRNDLLAYTKKPFDIHYQYYGKSEGLLTNEFNGGCEPCAVRLENGIVSLPSLDGLVWFNPEKVKPELPDQPLLTDRYESDGKMMKLKDDNIRLGFDPKQVVVHFTTAFAGDDYNLMISYAIRPDGNRPGRNGWLPVHTKSRSIHLGDLRSGKYFLHIRKRNGFGVDNYAFKKIQIDVQEHWYEMLWFRLACALGLLLAIWIAYQYRIRHLEKRARSQERIIDSRTAELRETMLALQSSEKELAHQMHIQTRLIASISHDVKAPMKFLKRILDKMVVFIEQENYEQVGTISSVIRGEIGGMYTLLDNMTLYMKTQVYGEQIKLEEVNLYALVKSKSKLFENSMQENGNQIIIDIPPTIDVLSHEHMLSILIHNLIDNAGKYSRKNKIMIFTQQNNHKLHLIVSDAGPGIPMPLVDWINSESLEDAADQLHSLSNVHHGLGLILVKEISKLLQIKLYVEIKNGTLVHLIFNRKL